MKPFSDALVYINLIIFLLYYCKSSWLFALEYDEVWLSISQTFYLPILYPIAHTKRLKLKLVQETISKYNYTSLINSK